ncbi:MAG: DUF4434 domain-containing protein [Clostridia bacterium]|nr:DUF4434 domain-containing protein [Clostridia bacterium]
MKERVITVKKAGPITGTFIDEITYDIPSSNWSFEQWRQDLDNMQEIGIDTLVFIRGGFGGKTIYPSKVFGTLHTDDLADFILREASDRGMDVFFGLYTSNLTWNDGDAGTEIFKNKFFIDEVWERYGHYPSFKGWYIPQEVDCDRLNICDVMKGLSGLCKDKAPDKQVLISPFFKSHIDYPDGRSPRSTYEEWDRIFDYAGKDIDICAFQDGTAPLHLMDEYYGLMQKLCNKYDIKQWVNAETFERDVRCMYYPIPFSVLKERLEHHKKYSEKIITFEFSHFLSPQSIYPSARNLNNLYKNYYLK